MTKLTDAMLEALRVDVRDGLLGRRHALDSKVHWSTVKSLATRGYVLQSEDGVWLLTPKGQRASAWMNLIESDLHHAITALAEMECRHVSEPNETQRYATEAAHD